MRPVVPIVALFLASAIVAQELQPAFSIGDVDVYRARLENGLTVLVVPDATAEEVNVGISFAVGTRHETAAESGLAHLTEHVMFSGTRKIGDNEQTTLVKEAGGEANAYTRADYTFYYDHGLPPDQLDLALELEADRMENLAFDEAGCEREWKALLQEERNSTSDGERKIGHLRRLAFGPDHYGVGILKGRVHTSSESLTREMSREFWKEHYRPDCAVVVVHDIAYD